MRQDYGFSSEMSDVAIRLHNESYVVDACNVGKVWEMDEDYFKRLRAGGTTVAFHTVAIHENAGETMKLLAQWQERFARFKDYVLEILTENDIEVAKNTNRTGILLGIQNGDPLDGEIYCLLGFYRLGVRVLQLTYNHRNHLGDGCLEPTDNGLSLFGKEVVAKMNELCMVVDVAHTGEKTSQDACKFSKHPIICSHSNVKAIQNTPRNISDTLIKAIAEKGGVVGIDTMSGYLKPASSATVYDMLNHVEYIAERFGVDHVGFGLDIASGGMRPKSIEFITKLVKENPNVYPPLPWEFVLQDVNQIPRLTEAMLQRGYKKEDIKKILGGNFVRVLRLILSKAHQWQEWGKENNQIQI